MEDLSIVELYWKRDETAISETERKYGKYLSKIAYNILADPEDSRECVSDTYLKAWNTMPENRPTALSAYLGKITRQISIDAFRRKHSEKRKASEYSVSLSELEGCVSGSDSPEGEAEARLLGESISSYLRSVSDESRKIFVCRYYFADSVKDIASYFGISEAKTKNVLYRTRLGLRKHLEEEGFTL
ncbi:MAG: RNA polymerase sigma factor [Eubacteriales bacterium]